MIGQVIGTFIGGPLTDLYGRRKNAIGNVLGMTISMLMSLIPGGIFMFSAARLLQGYFYAAGYNAVYVIFIEYLPKKKRAMVAPFIDMASGFSSIFVGLAGFIFTSWRHTILFYSVNLFLCFISCIFYPESTQWLESKSVQTSMWTEFGRFRRSQLTIMVTIKLISMWIAGLVLFYGMTLNSQSMIGNLSTNMIILGLSDSFSTVTLMILSPRVSRRSFLAITYGLSGAVLITNGLLQKYESNELAITLLTFIGKYTASLTISLIYLYTAELYPTSCRSLGFTICTGVGRTINTTLPFIVNAGRDIIWLPAILFASIALISCLTTLTLPDTTNVTLFNSIDEAEIFYKTKNAVKITVVDKLT